MVIMLNSLILSDDEMDKINKYLKEPKDESECLSEDEKISHTIKFTDGFEMDIEVCGVQYREGECNSAWTQAILYDENGKERCCSEVGEEFEGEWSFEIQNGVGYYKYVVYVMRESDFHKWHDPKAKFPMMNYPVLVVWKENDTGNEVPRLAYCFDGAWYWEEAWYWVNSDKAKIDVDFTKGEISWWRYLPKPPENEA